MEKLHELHNNLPFLPERMKIEKFEKLVSSLHDKTEYVTHIRTLKPVLNHTLVFKQVQRVIKFHENAWLKSCVHMNTDLRTKKKTHFGKDLFKLMNNAVLGKTMENVKKHKEERVI